MTDAAPSERKETNTTSWVIAGFACLLLYAYCAYIFGYYSAASIVLSVILISAAIAGKMTDAIIIAAGDNKLRQDELYQMFRTRLVPALVALGFVLIAAVFATRLQHAPFVATLIISTAVLATVLSVSPLIEATTRGKFNAVPLTDSIFIAVGRSRGWKEDESILIGRALMTALTLASAINAALVPIIPIFGAKYGL